MVIKLKPVEYTPTSTTRTGGNLLFLKALQVSKDPKVMQQFAQAADVYRTLDKMSMRREYHDSLAKSGVSFDFIVEGIKDIATDGFKDGDRLKAYLALLKSVGMDKYDAEAGVGEGSWEQILMKKIEDEKKTPALVAPEVAQYEVKLPVVPESVKKAQADEAEMTSTLYESTTPPANNK